MVFTHVQRAKSQVGHIVGVHLQPKAPVLGACGHPENADEGLDGFPVVPRYLQVVEEEVVDRLVRIPTTTDVQIVAVQGVLEDRFKANVLLIEEAVGCGFKKPQLLHDLVPPLVEKVLGGGMSDFHHGLCFGNLVCGNRGLNTCERVHAYKRPCL